MTGSSATTMWGITELPACVIQQIQLCSTLVVHSYSFLHMPSIHCNAIFSLILIHTIQYYSQQPEMFLLDGCDHQNLKDESSRLKVKAPSHGRRAKNRLKMRSWMRYHSVSALHLFCQDGRQYKGQWVDNSTSAKRCVCVCVCFRLFSCFFGQYANVLNMNLTIKPFLFCQVLFVWNLESWSRTLLRKAVMILVLWLKQNSDSSVNLQCVCAADSCANDCKRVLYMSAT